jgi:hypothetical protein
MGVVRVEEDREVVFLSQAPHQSGYLLNAEKFPLSLGGADRDRDLEVPRGGDHRLQENHFNVADLQTLGLVVADQAVPRTF